MYYFCKPITRQEKKQQMDLGVQGHNILNWKNKAPPTQIA